MSTRQTLTVTIAIVRSDFLPDTDVLDDTEGDVPPFTEKFNVMVAIMLWRDRSAMGSMLLNRWNDWIGIRGKMSSLSWTRSNGERWRTYVHKAGWAQKEVVLLELLGMDDTKVATDANAFGLAAVGTLELFVLFLCEVSHGAFELGDDGAGCEGTSCKDT